MDDVNKNDMIFILGEGVRFEPEKRCLINDFGVLVNLSENSYRFLLLLLDGETDKQNIINQVWHEQRGSVSDSSYYGQIYMLRKSLGQVGLSSSLIKTIPRKGVKYTGNVLREKNEEKSDFAVKNRMSPIPMTTPMSSYEESNKKSSETRSEWYHSRRWNMFISILALLAVCWISTLIVIVIIFMAK